MEKRKSCTESACESACISASQSYGHRFGCASCFLQVPHEELVQVRHLL
jgi:hypothetical protein